MKYYRLSLFLIFFSILWLTSCSKDSMNDEIEEEIIEEVVIPKEPEKVLTNFNRQSIAYFKEIALGFEFGTASEVTRKWTKTIKVYTYGAINSTMDSTLTAVITDIERITGDNFSLELVETEEEANFKLFVGSYIDYGNEFPDKRELLEFNMGLFSLRFDGNNEFTTGEMYVDTERTTENRRIHILREELVQSLGLAKDSNSYSDSIFNQNIEASVTAFSSLDEELIRLLYHPDMKTGLNEQEVDDLLKKILLDEQ